MVKSKEYMALYRARGYGDWFESLATFQTARGEVKVLRSRITKNNFPVDRTITQGRIYAQIDKKHRVTKLFFFDDDGMLSEMWDTGGARESHRHRSSSFHRHPGPGHGEPIDLTKAEREFAREVDRRWRRRYLHGRTKLG